ncbi:MAG TPA: BON domain-containing protein [Candidatus Dormibacteraeota bacterium]
MDLTFFAIVIMGGWVVAIAAAGLVMVLRPGGVTIRLGAAGSGTGTPTGPRNEILLGGDAEVLGNVRGRVEAVSLRPQSRELQSIELATGLGLETQTVVATAILSADGQVLRLAENWTEASEEAQAAGLTLRADATVVSVDGKRLGKLRLVCFEPDSRMVTALVIARRGPEQRLLTIDRVKEAGPDQVVTDLRAADWAKLPLFATDWEIKQAVTEQLIDDPRLRAGQRSMTIDVQDQVVTLRGYVTDQSEAEEVARIVRSVPSVLQVDRKLVTDADLARAVAAAIARDPAASAAAVNVIAHYGTVDITGEAPDRATARAVERVAGQVPGVQALHNMVGVRKPAGLAS